MKDEDTSHDVPTPNIFAHQHENCSDPALPSISSAPQEVQAKVGLSRMERRLTLPHHMRLVLLVIVVVVLAGGYGALRAFSPPTLQTSSAFQQIHCPFPHGQGLVEGQNVKCGFLVVSEDRSQLKGHTIRLAVTSSCWISGERAFRSLH